MKLINSVALISVVSSLGSGYMFDHYPYANSNEVSYSEPFQLQLSNESQALISLLFGSNLTLSGVTSNSTNSSELWGYTHPFNLAEFQNDLLSNVIKAEQNATLNLAHYHTNSSHHHFNHTGGRNHTGLEYRLTSEGVLLTSIEGFKKTFNSNTTANIARNVTNFGYTIVNGTLNFAGLDKFTVNINGPLVNVNLPGSVNTFGAAKAIPLSFVVTTRNGTALPHFPLPVGNVTKFNFDKRDFVEKVKNGTSVNQPYYPINTNSTLVNGTQSSNHNSSNSTYKHNKQSGTASRNGAVSVTSSSYYGLVLSFVMLFLF